jgi:hypothetical protein
MKLEFQMIYKCVVLLTSNVLRQVVIDDNIKTIKEIHVNIYDMARTQSNDLLLSINRNSKVKLLKRSGQMNLFLSLAPLITTGIHVNNNNDIIMGVVEEYTYKPTSCY